MKKYIREIFDDLRKKERPKPPVAEDLQNQTLSKKPLQRLRQIDFQEQKDEERRSG
jgi:hypothetical protein